MTAGPSEFVNGKHWADVIGCDMRAGINEIQRAAKRRAREVLDGPLRGEYLGAALQRINDALDEARIEKRAENPRRTGRKWDAAQL